MPYHLELGSDGHSFHGKAIVVNTMTGRHHSAEPIPMKKAEAQKRVLEAADKKDDPPKKKFIQEVVSSPEFKKGAFTAQAKKHGMTAKEFMEEVLSHPDEHSVTTRRRAQFMKNIQRK